jgi:hypothetical protein
MREDSVGEGGIADDVVRIRAGSLTSQGFAPTVARLSYRSYCSDPARCRSGRADGVKERTLRCRQWRVMPCHSMNRYGLDDRGIYWSPDFNFVFARRPSLHLQGLGAHPSPEPTHDARPSALTNQPTRNRQLTCDRSYGNILELASPDQRPIACAQATLRLPSNLADDPGGRLRPSPAFSFPPWVDADSSRRTRPGCGPRLW